LLLLCLAATNVLGKKTRNLKKQHEKLEIASKKNSKPSRAKQYHDLKGTKKQLLGYPEPDGRESTAYEDFGQGGLPPPGFGGLGKGGLGSEVEGMAVGMGGGGEPLGFQGEDAAPGSNFRVPGIAGPSNFGENAEVGRGSDEDNNMLSRYGEKEDVEAIAQRAMSRFDGFGENEAPLGRDSMQQLEPDESVTKAIGRPFDPRSEQGNMDERQDSPFQNVKQENPFQVPMHSIADQASFAESQMQKFRPESGAQLGPQQEETPFQPQYDGGAEEPGFDGQEDANFQATAMNGAEAMMGMGMSEQGGMKRHRTKMSSKKSLSKAIRQKKISKKSQLKKNYS